MANGLFTLKQINQALRQSAWTNQKPPSVNYLVVAGGGGGGGGDGGGGGGAGGVLTGVVPVTTGSSITVTVGGGGNSGNGYAQGSNGVSSVFGVISTAGGGGGGIGGGASNSTAGSAGGSGGGGGGRGSFTGGQGVLGQGNRGGTSAFGDTGGSSRGAGGGGAGTIGLTSTAGSDGTGVGGAGIASSMSGAIVAYAGGGAGGGQTYGATSIGGVGGGGSAVQGGAGGAGTTNTGGGGAGGSYNANNGGNGGSGIVILSYPDTYAAAASSTNATVTTSGSGSINFTSSGKFTIANNAAFQFNAGDFTIEAFVYGTSWSAYQLIAKCADDSSWGNGWAFNLYNGIPQFYIQGVPVAVGTTSIGTSSFAHIAVVRNGTTVTIYVNGSSVATATSLATITPTQPLSVAGEISSANYYLNGYISNLRIVKGSAIYTSNFTAPTAPLTSVSGTSLLLSSVSGAFLADSSGNGFTPATTTNSPTWNSASPFATGLGYKNRVYTWTTSGSITF